MILFIITLQPLLLPSHNKELVCCISHKAAAGVKFVAPKPIATLGKIRIYCSPRGCKMINTSNLKKTICSPSLLMTSAREGSSSETKYNYNSLDIGMLKLSYISTDEAERGQASQMPMGFIHPNLFNLRIYYWNRLLYGFNLWIYYWNNQLQP